MPHYSALPWSINNIFVSDGLHWPAFQNFFHKVGGFSAVYIQVKCAETENDINFFSISSNCLAISLTTLEMCDFWLICTSRNTIDLTRYLKLSCIFVISTPYLPKSNVLFLFNFFHVMYKK